MLGEYKSMSSAGVASHLYMLMIATGGSCIKAIEVLMSHGVKEDKIIFLNLVSNADGPRLQQLLFSSTIPKLTTLGIISRGYQQRLL